MRNVSVESDVSIQKWTHALDELKETKDNWNGYGSAAPNNRALSHARRILELLHDFKGLEPSLIAPSAEEGVGISFQTALGRGIIECYNNGNIAAGISLEAKAPETWIVPFRKERIRQAFERIHGAIRVNSR